MLPLACYPRGRIYSQASAYQLVLVGAELRASSWSGEVYVSLVMQDLKMYYTIARLLPGKGFE